MAQRNPRGARPPSLGDTDRANGALLEELRSRLDRILEAVNGSCRRLDAELDDLYRHQPNLTLLRKKLRGEVLTEPEREILARSSTELFHERRRREE